MAKEYSENQTLLSQAQHEIFMRLLPVIVCMVVVGIVGILGNILTIIFYVSKSRRCPSTIQISCLATVDLLVCFMVVPNIVEMVININYDQSFMCKLTHFFGLWTIASSCLILWIIALDRHRKICKPFVKQMTVKTTEHAIVGIVVFSFFLSVRNFANFDSNEVHVFIPVINRTLNGLYCTTRDDPGYKISVTIFHSIDFLLLLMVWITIVVCYTRIICTLFKMKRTKKRQSPSGHVDKKMSPEVNMSEDSDDLGVKDSASHSATREFETYELHHLADSPSSSTEFSTSNTLQTATEITHSPVIPTVSRGKYSGHHSLRRTVTKMNARKRKRRRKIAARSASERNLTFMMFTVSFLFVLCFFPYFVIKIIMRLVLKTGEEFELSVGIQFALRLVYFNSVFNPIVYCFFNPQFRQYIKGLFLKCIGCLRKN